MTLETIQDADVEMVFLSHYPTDLAALDDGGLAALQNETRRAHFWLSAERVRRQYAEEFPDAMAILFTNGGHEDDGLDSWDVYSIGAPNDSLRDEATPVCHLDTIALGLGEEGEGGAFVLDLRTLRFLDPFSGESILRPGAGAAEGSGLWQCVHRVQVLRDSPPPWSDDLSVIADEIATGPSSGVIVETSVRQVSRGEMVILLIAHGCNPSFLVDEGV